MKRPTLIYGLTDDLGIIRYVGKTVNPKDRYRAHVSAKTIPSLAGMAIIEVAQGHETANDVERKWIAFFGLENLFNRTKGGGAWADTPTIEHRQNIRIGLLRHWEDESERRKASIRMVKYLQNPGALETLCARNRRHSLDPLWRAKVKEALAPIRQSPEYRMKLSLSAKASWDGDEQRRESVRKAWLRKDVIAKRAATLKAQLATPEGFRKRSELMKKLRNTPQSKIRQSESSKSMWADPAFKAKQLERLRQGWAKRRERLAAASEFCGREELAHVQREVL